MKTKNSLIENLEKDVLLSKHTTFKIGGPAKFFIKIKNRKNLFHVIKWAKKKGEKILILGGGSNLLISDKGFDGLVIKLENKKYDILNKKSESEVVVECEAGVNLSGLALELSKKDISGLEWAVGIPQATIGGAVRGNAGAFGISMSDLIENVECFSVRDEESKVFDSEECEFSYRESIFKKNKDILIWKCVLNLKRKSKDEIDLQIKKNVSCRRNKHPQLPSAGSVFKNTATIREIERHSKQLADNFIKRGVVNKNGIVATGILVQELGLRGKKIGGAKISEKHGNFIVNTGNATAENVIILMSLIKQKVRDNFGVQLEEEIQLVGF